MTLQVVPLLATPAQTFTASLGEQRTRANIYQKAFGMFVDLYVNDVLIIGGVKAHNLTKIVRDAYLGFIGELYFFDTQGNSDPTYDGLGGRYVLIYSTDAA